MASALRQILVALKVKADTKQLDTVDKIVGGLSKKFKKLDKSGLKGTSKESKKTEKNLKGAAKEGKKLSESAKKTKKEMKGMSDLTRGIVQGISQAATQFGLMGLKDFISETSESISQLDRWSGRLGINIRELESWTQLSGMFGADLDDVTDAFKELQLKARDALDGTQSYIDVFKLIGISTDDLRNNVNDLPALMNLFTTQLNRNTDAATQAFVADELMSDAGTRMLEVFRMGTDEITRQRRALLQQNQATEQLAIINRELIRYVARLRVQWTNFRNKLLVKIIPAMLKLASTFTKIGAGIIGVISSTEVLAAAAIVLGVVFAKSAAMTLAAWAPVIAAWTFWIVGILAVIVLLGEIIATINGADTALKGFLEDIGVWDYVVERATAVRDVFNGIVGIFNTLRTSAAIVFPYIVTSLVTISNKINEILGYISTIPQGILTFLGIGGTAEEISGPGGEGRRLGARVAEQQRGTIGTAISALPIPGASAIGSLVSGLGSGQRERRSVRQRTAREQAFKAERRRQEPVLDQTAREAAFELFGPSVLPEFEQVGSSLTQYQGAAPPVQNVSITAPQNINMNISEATDAEQVGRIVRGELNEHRNQQNRDLQNALVPEGAS